MEAKEKMKLASGAVILLTLAVLALLSALGVYSLDKSWPVLILVFALFTLAQSPRDAGGWIIGAAGLMFLFFANWFGHVGEVTLHVIRSVVLISLVFIYFKYMRKKAS